MKIRSKAAAILAALSLMGGTAIAAPAAPLPALPASSEATNVDSNVCVIVITQSPDVQIVEYACIIFSNGSF